MLARIRKAQDNESGFTLIELLVVMIIIGILAAIAIPAFLNQKKKANETAAKSDATNIGKELAAALVDGPFVAAPTLTQVGTSTTYTLATQTTADSAAVSTTVKVSAGDVPSVGSYTTAPSATATSTNYCVLVTPANGNAWYANQNGIAKGASCPAS